MSVFDTLKEENYMIGIPSRERTFLIEKKGGVWRYLNKAYPVVMAVRESEEMEYKKALGYDYPTVSVELVTDDAPINIKRKGLFDKAVLNGIEYLFIIDDDVVFYFRDETLSSKYTSRAEDFERLEAFDRILYESICLCDESYPVVGLPLKQGSFNLKYTFAKNIPVIRFVCYHVPTLVKENIDICGLGTTYMSDRFVQLSLLEKGHASLSNCRWCVGDPGTGYKGGAYSTRRVELQEGAAKALTTRFPKSVSLKWKENGVWADRRLDCSIKWSYYLKEGERNFIPAEDGLRKILCRRKTYVI